MERIEHVVWIDSAAGHDQRWYDRAELELDEPLGYCYTCGFLVGETDEHVTIAHTICEAEISPFITIPKVAIIKRLLLGEDSNEATPARTCDCDCSGAADRGASGVPTGGLREGEDPRSGPVVGWAAVQAAFESSTR